MILRRVIQHFRKQEWTAIFLDFVIVVVGVFVATQVSNWNEARADEARARALLGQLQAEFIDIRSRIEKSHSDAADAKAAAARVLAMLQYETNDIDKAALDAALDDVMTPNIPPPRSAIFQQMVAGGDLNLIHDDKLVGTLITYERRFDYNAYLFNGILESLAGSRSFYDATRMRLFAPDGSIDASLAAIDVEKLRAAESEFEVLLLYQWSAERSLETSLQLADEILALIGKHAP